MRPASHPPTPGPDGDAAAVMERLATYVRQETPSRDAPRLLALAEVVEAELGAAGAVVQRFDAPGLGRNLRAEFRGRNPELPHLLLLGHLDTVHPVGTLSATPFRVADDRVYGPGVYDMKAGVALMVEALSRLAEGARPSRNVALLLTCDEEIGSHASQHLIEDAARGAAAVLVPEPSMPDGGVKTARKAVSTYRLEVRGRAAHAGIEPESAVSATVELAHQILAISHLADTASGTTINFGTMAGGTATNVVPADAWTTVDVRAWTPEDIARIDHVLATLEPRLPGAVVKARRLDHRPPLVRTEEVARLYERARGYAGTLGRSLGEGGTGGGSDGCLTAALGIPTLDGLGPRGGGAHTLDEHISLSDLPFRLALMMRLIEDL